MAITSNLVMISVLLAVLLTATLTAAYPVEPIWLSPSLVGKYAEQFPEQLGVWSNISVGAGSRYRKPIVVMDSQKILWILLGTASNNNGYANNVWIYDPKTDLYQWIVSAGNSTTNPRDPGTLLVPSPNNHPALVFNTPGTIDRNDNIWFMTAGSYSSELWMFNTTTHFYTRIKGDSINASSVVIGTLGQPSEDVRPGRIVGGCLVTDSLNNLWQIAGNSFNTPNGPKNRIWRFNTTSFQWTFFGGNDTSFINTTYGDNPFYGTRDLQGCDIDDDDRVWLFGGTYAYGNTIVYNDVWSYDTRTLQWRLEFGTNASILSKAAVAKADDFDAGNHPAAKIDSSLIDRKDGTLLLIGGANVSSVTTNDVWLFSKTLKQWKLIYGDPFQQELAGNFSHYRTPGSVMPAGRNLHGSARGLNIEGDVFVYGGQNDVNVYNDIWLIPQDQCNVSSLNKCSSNARCIEAMIGYSCECNDGFVGDGFTCTGPPTSPVSTPSSPNSPSTPGSSTTPRDAIVSRGVTAESSLFIVLSFIVLAIVSFY